MFVLPQRFYQQHSTLELAQRLLGCHLVRETSEGIASGIIVETEAYLHRDPACHAYTKPTERNKSMFLEAGTSYVYLIYGLYHCFNVVTGVVGVGEAVLIRALEPVKGVKLMESRRLTNLFKNLCSGPGKLATALGIDRSLDTHNLTQPPIYILGPDNLAAVYSESEIVTTTRIGLTRGVDLPYRFYVRGNQFISRK